jgi:UDP-glucose 4-epimerase
MTILVTGSAGHLGEALMRTFRADATDARGLDLKPSDFTRHVGSITDRAFVRHAMTGVRAVIHAATLHKPHVATHARQDFIDTNITRTLVLLEEAVAAGIDAFIFTSTTSTFGAALSPTQGKPAAWITEEVVPVPKNIYGVTKSAAEDLCALIHRKERLPVLILKTARFFPEVDDDAAVRDRYDLANVQALELLYRRADIADMVSAHLAALSKARAIGFGRYIISATTPFGPGDLATLHSDAPAVIQRLFPDSASLFATRGWGMFPSIDRVYVNARARAELGWQPRYDFRHVLACLRAERDFRSALALAIGSKGYHAESFAHGPYPVA